MEELSPIRSQGRAGTNPEMRASVRQPQSTRPARTCSRRPAAIVCALLASTLLAGCEERSTADLEAYAMEVLARQGGEVEPLPEIKPYEVYTYRSSGGINPFAAFDVEPPAQEKQQASTNGITPNFNRIREELESATLDSLRMVGTLEQEEQRWAIVRSPDGVIHRVQVGNYLGRNHGRIQSIDESGIALMEIIPDGQGGWQERPASLALVE